MRIRAVIFDWAGTLVDFGSLAPVQALRDVFHEAGIELRSTQIRHSMGLGKRDHIRAIGMSEPVDECWRARHGAAFGETDAERLYEAFIARMPRIAAERGKLIGGVAEAVRSLRERDIMVGSTTGYTSEIMRPLADVAAAQGLSLDSIVCADEVAESRPSPLALYASMAQMGVYPPASVVKVDDTAPGLIEGRSAGAWAVGVYATGNEVGLDEESLARLPESERVSRCDAAARRLTEAGAHYAIGTASELVAVIDDIDERLAEGERPDVMEI